MPPQTTFPLTPTQQGMLFHHISDPQSGIDVEQIICSLPETLDLEALQAAWAAVISRHETLRASFNWDDPAAPRQAVTTDAFLPIRTEDWRQMPDEAKAASLEKFLQEDRKRGFDLGEAPCMRITAIRTGDARWEMIWTVHHILCDGRSFPLVLGDLFTCYDERISELRPDPAMGVSFADHVDHVLGHDAAAAEAFWRERLEGIAGPTPLPAAAVEAVAERGHVERALPQELRDGLRAFAEAQGVSLGVVLQAAWAMVLARWSGEDDVVFGATRAGRAGSVEGADNLVGCMINTLPVRVTVDESLSVVDWLSALHTRERAVRPFDQTALMDIQRWSGVGAGQPLFESLIVFDRKDLDGYMKALGPAFADRHFRLVEQTNYPLTLYAYADPVFYLRLAYDSPRFDADIAQRLLASVEAVLQEFVSEPTRTLESVSGIAPAERRLLLSAWNDTDSAFPQDMCIHHAIEQQVDNAPDAVAIISRGKEHSYAELNASANRLAHHLLGLGVGPDVPVGILAERNIHLMVAILAIHKAGGCYLPLDPEYPRERLRFMIEDSRAPVLLSEAGLHQVLPDFPGRVVIMDEGDDAFAGYPAHNPFGRTSSANLAYLIYTSGSTGKPKGVMVEHRNVLNFFTAMDSRVPRREGQPGTWLAVTSLSFDISVLELLWTLARGFRVVLHEDQQRAAAQAAVPGEHADTPMQFSLMYFSSAETAGRDKYRLLMEGAKFADENGFAAVWTPERHFHEFGGLYPNPSLMSIALAMETERVAIRAGSVVAPLHHPARIAEEWSVADNLSGGRVGVAFASGWQPRDFLLKPEAFGDRPLLLNNIDKVQKLWRGEEVEFVGPGDAAFKVRTLPTPVQPALPMWLTAAGSPDTFRTAGELGAGVLTHLLGQSKDELAEKLAIYRDAWKQAGHAGDGHVTLMLHTFVGEDTDEVREIVRGPMVEYLKSSLGLVKGFAGSWTAFKKKADGSATTDVDLDSLTEDEMAGLLDYSFERYFETSALFGDLDRTAGIVDELKGLGIDEVASLIDFGVDENLVLEHLRYLDRLRRATQPPSRLHGTGETITEQIEAYDVTHLQCTPSLASMLLEDEGASSLANLHAMLVGGEAFPTSLAQALRGVGVGTILNMYGPTETTIWSAVHEVTANDAAIPIGKPIANTSVYILNARGSLAPLGAAGELCIGGAGVTRGYYGRPELTAERFVPDRFGERDGRVYRTGDLARWRDDGSLEFLGRLDHQVKIRGYRIELGEIEAALCEHDAVREAVVIPREDTPGDVRLVAYIIPCEAGSTMDRAEFRQLLRSRLPESMVPAHYVELDQFPMTPNRKIDRKALPAPAVQQTTAGGSQNAGGTAAAGSLEAEVSAIWQDVLQLPSVGLDDNFFDLGGHSLLAVKLHRRLCDAFEKKLVITDLFRFATVRTLAAYLGSGEDSGSLQDSQDRAERRRQSQANRRRQRVRQKPTV